jgi:eukaryotic-like serine/threonine-protein kinase
MPLAVGTRIGAYEIVGLLGAGGMGEVYRARDSRLHRDVAIKILPDTLAADPVARGRFETEARAVASLSHPNIIAIHDVGHEGRVAYAVMELLEGRSLRDVLSDGAMPVRKAIDYGSQVAAGLAAAHARGVIHRDLKPENIIVTRDGRAKILDFGLAKPASAVTPASGTFAATYTPTTPGTVLGTVGYMSPEQVRGENVDHRSDIFSLGTILYEMFSGHRAFSGGSAVETMNAILKEDPQELSNATNTLPPAIERIVRRALEKDLNERFQSARDLGFALEALSGSSTTSAAAMVPASGHKRWFAASAVGVGILALVAAIVWGGPVRDRFARTPAAAPPIRFSPKTYDPETIWNARFIRNDGSIVFSASLEGNVPHLFVSRPDVATPQPIGPAGTHLLSVASTGELLVLTDARHVLHRLFSGTLARMTLDGSPRPWLEDVRDADWSPDGTTIAAIRTDGATDRLEYPLGTVLRTTNGYLSDVRVSPDGNHVAFMEHPSRFDDRGIVRMWDRSGGVRTISEEFWGLQSLSWDPSGDVLYFGAASSNYMYQLQVANAIGRVSTRPVLPAPDSLYVFDIARDGRWAVSRQDRYSSIRVLLPGETKERELRWQDSVWYPQLSADGRLLVFTDGNSSGSDYAVAMRRTDGSPPVRLGEGDSRGISPDGKHALAYLYTSKRIVIYPTGAGDTRTVATPSLQEAEPFGWFPDGKRIVVCGREAGKAFRCYGQDLNGGKAIALTPEGFTTNTPSFSPDGGSLIAYGVDEKPQIVTMSDGALHPVAGSEAGDVVAAWTPDGRAVLASPRGVLQIDRIELATGIRALFRRFELAGNVGVNRATAVTVTTDVRGYGYAYTTGLSRLFLVTGAAGIGKQ